MPSDSIYNIGHSVVAILMAVGFCGVGLIGALPLIRMLRISQSEIIPFSLCSGIAATGLSCALISNLGQRVHYIAPLFVILASLGWSSLFLRCKKNTLNRKWYLIGMMTVGLSLTWAIVLQFAAGGLSPTNDLFTYVSCAQWLQDHSFTDPIVFSPDNVSTLQPASYQTMGFRMGAIYILAFIQVLAGDASALQVAPIALGVLGSGFLASAYLLARWSLGFGRRHSLFFSILMFPVLVMCSLWSLLPQVGGLCAFMCSIALLDKARSSGGVSHRSGIGLSALAGLHAAWLSSVYSELLPVLFVPCFLFALWAVVKRPVLGLKEAAALAIVAALAGNAEWLRAAHALLTQKDAIVGGPMPMTMASHIGIMSGVFLDAIRLQRPYGIVEISVMATLTITASIGAVSLLISKGKSAFFVVALASALLLYCYFYFVALDPWSKKTGHTWSLFKLDQWMAPLWIGLSCVGWQVLYYWNKRVITALAMPFCVGWLIVVIGSARFTIQAQVAGLHGFGGKSAVSELSSLRAKLASQGASAAILIRSTKLNEPWPDAVYTYALQDYPLWSDWGGLWGVHAPPNIDEVYRSDSAVLHCGPILSSLWRPWFAGLMLLENNRLHVLSRSSPSPVEIIDEGETAQWIGLNETNWIIFNPTQSTVCYRLTFDVGRGPDSTDSVILNVRTQESTGFPSEIPVIGASKGRIEGMAKPGETNVTLFCSGSLSQDPGRADQRQLAALLTNVSIKIIDPEKALGK